MQIKPQCIFQSSHTKVEHTEEKVTFSGKVLRKINWTLEEVSTITVIC